MLNIPEYFYVKMVDAAAPTSWFEVDNTCQSSISLPKETPLHARILRTFGENGLSTEC